MSILHDRKTILVLAVLFIAGLLAVADRASARPVGADSTSAAQVPVLSGTLQARETQISAEISGRVTKVQVNKGDEVKAGEGLLELDTADIEPQLKEAEAAVRTAQANLDQVQEKARPGAIALAQAAAAQAESDLKAAEQAQDDVKRSLADPQELLTQLHAKEADVQTAQSNLAMAESALGSINDDLQTAAGDQSMAGKYSYQALQKQKDAAEASLIAARLNLAASQQVVELYKALVANPLELVAAQHAAANQVKVAEAGLAVAKANLQVVNRAAQPEAVALAQARLKAAQANLDLVRAQAKRYSLTSPLAGTVVDRNIEVGETARPGTALLTIADTRELEMTLYVPIRYLPALRVGQSIRVTLPSLPGEQYTGKVSYISPDAEFKPANIYNNQERSEMVFSVRVAIPNDVQKLKAGLPADARLE